MQSYSPPVSDSLGHFPFAHCEDEGETVYVDGVQDAALRSQLASFLSALGLTAPAKEVDGEKTPQAFRCSRGGGVLRCVASLMDERGMVHPPPLDRKAAFEAAKKASRKHLLIFRRSCTVCVCSFCLVFIPGT